MHTDKKVVLITGKTSHDDQNYALVTKISNDVIEIKKKSYILIYCISRFARFLKLYLGKDVFVNNNIKLIIISATNQYLFAKYLQKKFYKAAKIINVYTRDHAAYGADQILASNLVIGKIPKKYHSKCLLYKGILSSSLLPDHKVISIVDDISQPILWSCIGSHMCQLY